MVKQRQSQKQNVKVIVNLGEKKKKGKPKKRQTGKKVMKRETQIIPAFNPPPIINYPPMFQQYNQQPNKFLNPSPPIPQKQYSVFPEGETAPLSNILSTVPVELKLQTREPEPNLAKATTKAPDLPTSAPEVETSPFVTETEEPALEFFNEPSVTTNIGGEVEANIEPLLSPAEEESYKQLTSQYRAAELPVGLSVAGLSVTGLPEEPLSPSGSSISNITEEPIFTGTPSPSFFNVAGLSLPPLKLPARQPLIGAEEILNPPSLLPPAPEFVFAEGQTGRTGISEYSEPLTAKRRTGTLADYGLAKPPKVAETKEEASSELEAKPKKGGRPKGSTNKPKKGTAALSFPAAVAEAELIPTYELGVPIAEQPNIEFLGGSQKTFLAEQPPEKISNPLERRRGGAAVTPAEESLLAQPNIPSVFTQRSQTTL